MAQQTINIGAQPNSGSGDPLRTAGSKINSNFTEVYEVSQQAYIQANTGTALAQNSFNQANTANSAAQAAFNKANTANVTAQAAFNRANGSFSFRSTVLINTTSHTVSSNLEEVLLCDPNTAGGNIALTLTANVFEGRVITIKNINPGGYSVNVSATTIENPISKSFVSEVVMANTGEVYTWVSYSGVYRYIG